MRTKELEYLRTENENKALIIKSLLENLSQPASFPKKTFKRNRNSQELSVQVLYITLIWLRS